MEELKMIQKLIQFLKDDEGATAVEYGIMVAAIAAVIIAVVIAVGTKTENAFETINAGLPLSS
jgi:pilus assembly protein Flp/PilA